MNLSQRPQNTSHPTPPGDTAPDPASNNLPEVAQQAAALAAAGRDIIQAALSGDSEAFLRASRQAGGQ